MDQQVQDAAVGKCFEQPLRLQAELEFATRIRPLHPLCR